MNFSLIIPSYNNAAELMRELPGLMNYLSGNNMNPEVIIVNDGSTELVNLEQFCETYRYRLIHHKKNLGKGASVRTGMLAAANEICVFTDADIPFQYEIFKDIDRQFSDASIDIVCGDRRNSDYFRQTPAIRRMGSGIFSLLVNLIMLRNMGDTQCGIKAFRKRVLHKIFDKSVISGFAADIEWLYRANKNGIRVNWVKAEFRNAGESSVVFWKQAIRMLLDLLKLRFRG